MSAIFGSSPSGSSFSGPSAFGRIVALASILGLVLGGAAGCGLAEKAAQKATEKVIEKATDEKVNIDTKGGNLSIETEDGRFSAGMATEIPADWPDDVLVPAGFQVAAVQNLDGGDMKSIMLTGLASESYDELKSMYETAFADWPKINSTELGDGSEKMLSMTFGTEERNVHIGLSPSDDASGRALILRYVEKN